MTNAHIGVVLVFCGCFAACGVREMNRQEDAVSETTRSDADHQDMHEKAYELTKVFGVSSELSDGSYSYGLHLHFKLEQSICIPTAALGGSMLSMGTFVSGRLPGLSDFQFATNPEFGLPDPDATKIDISNEFLEVSFRSTRKADEIRASIPFVRCTDTRPIDWIAETDGSIETGWVSVVD